MPINALIRFIKAMINDIFVMLDIGSLGFVLRFFLLFILIPPTSIIILLLLCNCNKLIELNRVIYELF